MIKVLHIVTQLDGGGVENLLLNYYTHMNRDKFKFDFIVHGDKIGILEPIFIKMNSKIFHIPTKRESFIKNLRSMKQIIESGDYSVVHAHQEAMGAFPMQYAKKAGVRIRIAHGHFAFKSENIVKRIIDRFLVISLKQYATDWFACGIDAGKYLWGDNAVNKGKIHVMNNAIKIDRFIFQPNVRNKMREELGIEGKFVIGNVGRLSYQKNHEFLIRIFNEIYKINKNAVLLLVGGGELESDIKNQVANLNLNEAVNFMGVRNDVPNLLQAMDVFLLPSRYEGLGIVYIEAQAAGLVTFGSDMVVPKDAKVTDLMQFISLKTSAKHWANEVLKYNNGYERRDTSEEVKKAGYDIEKEAKCLERFYSKVSFNKGKYNVH